LVTSASLMNESTSACKEDEAMIAFKLSR
jgi:hypothetical protein